MKNKLINFLLQGDYKSAEDEIKDLSFDEIRETILSITYDTESLTSIGFVMYMKKKTNNNFWLEIVIELLVNPLSHIEGAYAWALHISKELLLIDRNESNLEMLLFFYIIPEKLISKEEALSISKEILKINPKSEKAQACLRGEL